MGMLNKIKNIIQNKYYRYNPGEFLPIFSNGELINKREFHQYRIKWIVEHRHAFYHQLTHTQG